MKAQRGSRNTLSLTSAPEGGGWSTPRPGHFTIWERDPLPILQKDGWAQGQSGRVRNISPSLVIDPRPFHAVASPYTDWAILAAGNRVTCKLIQIHYCSCCNLYYHSKLHYLGSCKFTLQLYIQKMLKATRVCVTTGCQLRVNEIFDFLGFYTALIRCGTTSGFFIGGSSS